MPEALVTVVVVPREQFGMAPASLASVRAENDIPHELVYVDGNSPPVLSAELARQANAGELTLVRRDYYLSGNEARNLGLRHVRTRYVLFLDNDVLVWPGCLAALVRCAEETDAWVVGPLYCIGTPDSQIVHTAGADLRIFEEEGRRRLHERHHHCDRPAADVRAEIGCTPRGEVEFHCLLARTEVFEKLGALDEGLVSYFDHTDFCLTVAKAGGTIFADTGAVVTYVPPPPLAWSDLPYFLLRWSALWYEQSLRHFCRKWGLDESDPAFLGHSGYRLYHRRQLLPRLSRISPVLEATVGATLERTLVHRLEQQRRERE